MNIGLKSGGIWTEIGDSGLLHAFFSSISYHLESNNWGSKYPYLLIRLYHNKLEPSEISNALVELAEVRRKLKTYKPDDVIWDAGDLSKNPSETFYSQPRASDLLECFKTTSGKNIFDVLSEVLEFCERRGISVKLQGESELIRLHLESDMNLNWGTVTPEFYNEKKNSAVHIFNHCLEGEVNIIRSLKFAIGRIEWFNTCLPKKCSHEVVFDDRGQSINDSERIRISEYLSKLASCVKFSSKG